MALQALFEAYSLLLAWQYHITGLPSYTTDWLQIDTTYKKAGELLAPCTTAKPKATAVPKIICGFQKAHKANSLY